MQNLIVIINDNADRIRLMVANAQSAAFILLFRVKCKIALVHGCMGMFHKSFLNGITMNYSGKIVWNSDQARIKNMKQSCPNRCPEVLERLTKSELRDYKRDYDVYFTYERMKEIFPDAERIGEYRPITAEQMLADFK